MNASEQGLFEEGGNDNANQTATADLPTDQPTRVVYLPAEYTPLDKPKNPGRVAAGLASKGNLRMWRKGESGNPAGRKPAGLTVIEWYNALAGKSKDQLLDIAGDPRISVAKRAAAMQWVQTLSKLKTTAGTPIRGEALDRICDRTAGRPVARQEVSGPGGGPIVSQVAVNLSACLSAAEQYYSNPNLIDANQVDSIPAPAPPSQAE